MLPRADIITVNPVGHAEADQTLEGSADARQEAFQRSLQGLLGKALQGEVLAHLTDGSFLVKVAGTSARMLLPPGVQVGHDVPLTLVSVSPRPTFELSTPGAQPHTVYSEAGPALLPGPPGSAARAEPLVYTDGAPGAAPAFAGGAPAPPSQRSALALPAGTVADAPESAAAPLPHAGPPGQPGAPLSHAGAAGQPGTPLPSGAAGLGAESAEPAGAPAAATRTAPAAAPSEPERPAVAPRAMLPGAVLLSKAPLTPASQLPELGANSLPASLSDAARMIASVLGAAPVAARNSPGVIVAHSPLAPNAQVTPEKLASALHDSVSNSGLFYESHVAEWVNGQRGLAELLREPQMQRAFASAMADHAAQAGAADPAAAQMINQQLHTGEQGRLTWQGQAWPGQPLEWDVSRDAPHEQAGSTHDQGEPVWRSGVRFHFPLLGDVKASVVLVGQQLHIQLQAGTPTVAQALRAHAQTLETAMQAAGSPLSSLAINAQAVRDVP